MANFDVNPNLTLFLPSDCKFEFYLYNLVLSEGLSRIASAELTLFSNNLSIRMNQLNKLVGKYATVEMKQTLADGGKECTRWFTGMITEAVHNGIVHTDKEKHTIKCGLLLQSPEANMRFSRHRRAFLGLTPENVLNTLLKPYGFTCSIPQQIAQEVPSWSNPATFYQNGESDYTFLLRLLMKYGLSYTMISQKPKDKAPGQLHMEISHGTKYALSDYEMEDAKNPISCSCRNSEQDHLSISNWKMSSRIAVDRAVIDYEDGKSRIAKAVGEKDSMRQVYFNHSPMGVVANSIAEEVLTNYLKTLQQSKVRWEGDLMRLDALPGMVLKVADFYGDDETVSARILASEMHFTAPWPTTLLGASEVSASKSSLNIHVNCMDSTSKTGFITPAVRESIPSCSENKAESRIEFAFSRAENAGDDGYLQLEADSELSQPVPFQAIQAVVCDVFGNTSSKTTNQSLPLDGSGYGFFACYPAGERVEIVLVTLVMPLGGYGEGLFHVPRQGDKVLIACVNESRYYLMGYLPDSNRPFINSNMLDGNMSSANQMTVLRRNKPGHDPLSYMNNNGNMMKTQLDRLTAAGTDRAKQKPNHQFSEIGIYYGTK